MLVKAGKGLVKFEVPLFGWCYDKGTPPNKEEEVLSKEKLKHLVICVPVSWGGSAKEAPRNCELRSLLGQPPLNWGKKKPLTINNYQKENRELRVP